MLQVRHTLISTNGSFVLEYLKKREARCLIEEVKVLCVEWRRHDRRTWITGPRLIIMQECAACRRKDGGNKDNKAKCL